MMFPHVYAKVKKFLKKARSNKIPRIDGGHGSLFCEDFDSLRPKTWLTDSVSLSISLD